MAISADELFAKTMSPELIEASEKRAEVLLEEYKTLQQLRKARAKTQEYVGKKLGTKQVSVAQLEKRSDFLLSTLRHYVEALGGRLELMVSFDDGQPVRLSGLGEENLLEEAETPKSAPRKAQKRPAAKRVERAKEAA